MTDDPFAITDLHSHLIPGVDDGARSIDDVLDSLGRMTRLGVTRIVTTPHFDGSLTRRPAAFEERIREIDEAWNQVTPVVRERFPELDFRRGQEVMLDIPDVDFTDPRLRLDGGPFVLVEWPRLQIPPGTPEVVARICSEGWRPIIAHPERYQGLDPALRVIGEWREAGAHLQGNYGSLVGRYGPEARSNTRRLLERGWIDYMSTDFHGRSHLQLFIEEVRELMTGAHGEEHWHLLSVVNSGRVFDGEIPLPVPTLTIDEGGWNRFRNFFRGPRR